MRNRGQNQTLDWPMDEYSANIAEGDRLMRIAMEQREIALALLNQSQRNEIACLAHWAKAEAIRFKQEKA